VANNKITFPAWTAPQADPRLPQTIPPLKKPWARRARTRGQETQVAKEAQLYTSGRIKHKVHENGKLSHYLSRGQTAVHNY
jgi:hypothetical protein